MRLSGGLINFPAANPQDSDPAQRERGQKPYQSMQSMFSILEWNVTRQKEERGFSATMLTLKQQNRNVNYRLDYHSVRMSLLW